MSTIDPTTDLLPDEQALLDGKTITPPGTTTDEHDATQGAAGTDTGTESDDTAALDAEALAAIAAKGERPADEGTPAATADDTSAAPAAPAPPTYVVDDPAKFEETRQALLTKKAEAMKGLMDGTIEVDAFMQVDAEVTAGLQELTKNATLHEANLQQERTRQQSALSEIAADGTKHGIDYTDPGLAALFDTKMRTLAATPEMAGKSASDIYRATHTEVLKLFGKTAAAPAPAPAPTPAAAATPAPAPAPKPQIPPTLGQMPNAAPVDIGNDLTNTIMSMDNPDEAEAMMARMPAAQRTSVLRATMPTTPNRRH